MGHRAYLTHRLGLHSCSIIKSHSCWPILQVGKDKAWASLLQSHSKQVFVRVTTTIPSCHPGLGQDDPGHNQRPNPGLPGRVCLHRSTPLPTSQVSAAGDNMEHPETLPIGLFPTADRIAHAGAKARGGGVFVLVQGADSGYWWLSPLQHVKWMSFACMYVCVPGAHEEQMTSDFL